MENPKVIGFCVYTESYGIRHYLNPQGEFTTFKREAKVYGVHQEARDTAQYRDNRDEHYDTTFVLAGETNITPTVSNFYE
jgi:hypothetical protein